MASREKTLDGLPLLVTDTILEYLDLVDIKSLRLTNKVLSEQCIGPRFKQSLSHQITDLSQRSLESLSTLASCPLASAVNDLTIRAIAFDVPGARRKMFFSSAGTPERPQWHLRRIPRQEVDQNADIQWMENEHAKQQSMLDVTVTEILTAILRGFGRLNSIKLDALIYLGPSRTSTEPRAHFTPIRLRGVQVYHIAMSAVFYSNVVVDTLVLYQDQPGCSVPTREIDYHMERITFTTSPLSSILPVKKMTLSLCVALKGYEHLRRSYIYGKSHGDMNAMMEDNARSITPDSFPGVIQLLRRMPCLEVLDLYLGSNGGELKKCHHHLFTAIAEQIELPLQDCSLHRISATEESMIQFLQNHSTIRYLTLSKVRLVSGSWKSVFSQFRSMPSLTRLRLCDLEGPSGHYEVVRLRPRNHIYSPDDYNGPSYRDIGYNSVYHVREFDAEAIKNELEVGGVLESPEYS